MPRFVASTAFLGAAGIGALWFGSLGSSIPLPQPRGPQAVGRSLFDWTDTARNRELMVFVWYPANAGDARKPAEYLPGKWAELARPRLLTAEVRGWSIQDAPPLAGTHPLLVLLPGMGGIPTDYTTIAEDLASFGYIVAGIAPTGSSRVVVFSNGRTVTGTDTVDLERRIQMQPVVDRWQGDCVFVLNQIQAGTRMNLQVDSKRIGVFGHSFGGAAAIHVLQSDSRFQRGVNLDGAPQGAAITRLDRPAMFVNGAPLPADRQALNDRILFEMKAICKADTAGCEWRDYPEAGHMNFSDRGAIPWRWPIPRSHFDLTNIDGPKFLHQISSDLRGFFDQM